MLTNEKTIEQFVNYIVNIKRAVDSGTVVDKTGELDQFFRRFLDIHQKVEKIKATIAYLKAALETIREAELRARVQDIITFLEAAERYLDETDSGSFRALCFQVIDQKQRRALDEIERRVNALGDLSERILQAWTGGAE